MAMVIGPFGLVPHLLKEGLIPDECGDVSASLPVNGVATITYTVFVTGERLIRFHRALGACLAEEAELEKKRQEGMAAPLPPQGPDWERML